MWAEEMHTVKRIEYTLFFQNAEGSGVGSSTSMPYYVSGSTTFSSILHTLVVAEFLLAMVPDMRSWHGDWLFSVLMG